MDAVRRLLEEGTFHEASVAEIAQFAGVSRATLYQHFGSRVGLVDAICGSISENPSMAAIQAAPDLADPRDAATQMIGQGVRFWDSEESLHRHLYGLAEIDESAADFVERQTTDRRSVVDRIVRRLADAGALRDEVSQAQARATLLVLTSFHTYQELRAAGLSLEEIERFAVSRAQELLEGVDAGLDDRSAVSNATIQPQGWRRGDSGGRRGSRSAGESGNNVALR
jgi:AcrR family transcriptional regulator